MDRKKILIVDDEKEFLRVADRRLVMEGFDVISADNGLLALSMANLNQPDLIMLDLQMPIIGGEETARGLKANQATKHIPVLFLSSLISSEGDQLLIVGVRWESRCRFREGRLRCAPCHDS